LCGWRSIRSCVEIHPHRIELPHPSRQDAHAAYRYGPLSRFVIFCSRPAVPSAGRAGLPHGPGDCDRVVTCRPVLPISAGSDLVKHYRTAKCAAGGVGGRGKSAQEGTRLSGCSLVRTGSEGCAPAESNVVAARPCKGRTRPKHNHSVSAVLILDNWFRANLKKPFPDAATRAKLSALTGDVSVLHW